MTDRHPSSISLARRACAQAARALAAGAVLIAICALSPAGARAAHLCNPPKYPGTGYFTSLQVQNTSCSVGDKVALAWYACRTKHGVAGKCAQHVLGFACVEVRKAIPTEYDARVTCTKGKIVVIHTYQQNT